MNLMRQRLAIEHQLRASDVDCVSPAKDVYVWYWSAILALPSPGAQRERWNLEDLMADAS